MKNKRKGRGAVGPAGPKGGGGARLGRQAAHDRRGRGRLGQKGRRDGREKRKGFSFSKNYFPLDESIHIFKQSKGMHGSTWCTTQNKIF